MAMHPKVLGLTLDSKLTYRTHIHNISIAQSVSALDFNFERAVGGSILTAGKKLSLKNLNVTIRAITNWSNLVPVMDWGGANSRFLGLVSVGAAQSLDQTELRPSVIKRIHNTHAKCTCEKMEMYTK